MSLMKRALHTLSLLFLLGMTQCNNRKIGSESQLGNTNNTNTNNTNNSSSPISCEITADKSEVVRYFNSSNDKFYDENGNEVTTSENVVITILGKKNGIAANFLILSSDIDGQFVNVINSDENTGTSRMQYEVNLKGEPRSNTLSFNIADETNLTNSTTCSVTIDFVGQTPPMVTIDSFTASDYEVPFQTEIDLSWETTHAKSCRLFRDTQYELPIFGKVDGSYTTGKQGNGSRVLYTYRYDLECEGFGQTETANVGVGVRPFPAPTIGARKASGGPLEPITLLANFQENIIVQWAVDYPQSVACQVYRNGIAENYSVGVPSGSRNYNGVTDTFDLEIRCRDTEESDPTKYGHDPVVIAVGDPPPEADLRGASGTSGLSQGPITLQLGQTINLTWNSQYADTCSVSPASQVPGFPNGSQSQNGAGLTTAPFNTVGQTTLTLGCSGAGGTTYDDLIINVAARPTATLTVVGGQTNVRQDDQAFTLRVASQYATSCSLSNYPGFDGGTSGDYIVDRIPANRSFSLTCQGPGGTSNPSTVNMTVKNQHLIFVTSQIFQGDLGGARAEYDYKVSRPLANAICTKLAHDAGLMTNHKFEAILSPPGTDVVSLLTYLQYEVRRSCSDRALVANTTTNVLFDNKDNLAPVYCDERGIARANNKAWTNTQWEGKDLASGDNGACENYTSRASNRWSYAGNTSSADHVQWLYQHYEKCDTYQRLLCISQEPL